MVDLTAPIFTDETAAREHLEAQRWPDGPVCPHCGSCENITKLQGKAHRPGLYRCKACKKQLTVTIGTVYERSHIPLHKWVLATHLLCASKKGMSAHQLHRTLDLPYKTAWFMAHRIRAGMAGAADDPEGLGGEGKIVEADETYFGKKDEEPAPSPSRKGRPYTKGGRSNPARKRAVGARGGGVGRGGREGPPVPRRPRERRDCHEAPAREREPQERADDRREQS